MPKQIGSLTLYSVPELAERLQVKPRTLRAYLKSGRLTGRKFARQWYVSEEALRDYFSEPEKLPKRSSRSKDRE